MGSSAEKCITDVPYLPPMQSRVDITHQPVYILAKILNVVPRSRRRRRHHLLRVGEFGQRLARSAWRSHNRTDLLRPDICQCCGQHPIKCSERRSLGIASGLLPHRSASRVHSHVREHLQSPPVACSTAPSSMIGISERDWVERLRACPMRRASCPHVLEAVRPESLD